MLPILLLFFLIHCIQISFSLDLAYFSQYRGYSIERINLKNDNEFKVLKRLTQNDNKITLLNGKKNRKWVNVLVSSDDKKKFKRILKISNLRSVSSVKNLETAIRNEYETSRAKLNDPFSYDKYQPLENIYKWIDELEQQYHEWIDVFNVSYSYEGRPLKMLKISIPNSNKPKPGIWIEGGIHSREWISPATVIYMTHQLLSKYKNDKNVTEILNTFDFYILPVYNVDGYVYTFETDRLWRKTRSINNNSKCIGTDPNRNWDYEWCTTGASKDPCSSAYCGSNPFSEIEVRGVAEYLIKNKDIIKCFMDFHSYGQLWMTPWGYTKILPNDYEKMNKAAGLAVDAIHKVYGTNYTHGNIADIIYEASGSSADWTYGKLNILYSFGIELRDLNTYGFELPADQILESGNETFEAVKALALFIKNDIDAPTFSNKSYFFKPSLILIIINYVVHIIQLFGLKCY